MKSDDVIRKNVLESMQTQVETFIRDKIGQGEWSLEAKIPSERELSEKLGAPVEIQHSGSGKGKLVVSYHSLDELDGIIAHIK